MALAATFSTFFFFYKWNKQIKCLSPGMNLLFHMVMYGLPLKCAKCPSESMCWESTGRKDVRNFFHQLWPYGSHIFYMLMCWTFLKANDLRYPFGVRALDRRMPMVLLQSFTKTVANVVVYLYLIRWFEVLSIESKQAYQWNSASMYGFWTILGFFLEYATLWWLLSLYDNVYYPYGLMKYEMLSIQKIYWR